MLSVDFNPCSACGKGAKLIRPLMLVAGLSALSPVLAGL